jgi:hypothetical protein
VDGDGGGGAGGGAGNGEGDGEGEDGGEGGDEDGDNGKGDGEDGLASMAATGGVTTRGGVARKVGGAGVTGVGDTGSGFNLTGVNSGGKATSDDAVGGVRQLEGEGGEKEGSVATPDGGEMRNSPSSSSPRSNSTSLRLLLVLLAGGETISDDGRGEASRCGLRGVDSTAFGVGVQGFSPAAVAAADTVVAMEGRWA